MPRSPEALVDVSLLIWARESAGLSQEQAARKLGVTKERLETWEKDKPKLGIAQLRKLGAAYRRPIAIFYLPEPPKDFQPLRDFRRLPGELLGELSSSLRFEIREAYSRREIALELLEETAVEPQNFDVRATLGEVPEQLAERVRQLLEITHEQQAKWATPHEALRGWRDAIEAVGVLVFQSGDVDLTEMRGFSIMETPLPVIVVNRKDPPRARIFTMVHELIHILLRKGGLCDLEDDGRRPPEEQRTEVFCNHVAGATLVPKKHLLAEPIVIAKGKVLIWSDEEIEKLSKAYNVSREAIVRRLLVLERTTKDFYEQKRAQYRKEYESRKKQEGFAPPYVEAVSSVGRSFARLVLDAFHQEKITASDVSDYFSVRLKHLSNIEHLVGTA